MTHDPYAVEPRKPLTSKHGDVVFRLWPKVSVADDDACWPFVGARTTRGYGKISAGGKEGKTLLAHRVMFAWCHGPIALTDVILHRCDNPSCCNPDHLKKGTLSDNTQDMIAKGRHFTPWRGENAKHARLTESDVKAIRSSPLGYRRLAKQYGVDRNTIGAIRRGTTWRHVK
jgi:hypothetical protein